jgi:hypothetical protein
VTSLFSESSAPAAELERYQAYKAISALAVASLGLGILSVLTFFQWIFALVPLMGVLLGMLARRQIRSRGHELTGLPLAGAGIILSTVMLAGGWGWLYYVYRTEVPEGYQRINYDLLQPNVDDQRFPTERALALNGEKVFIKGYMYPSSQQEVKAFTLCRDNGECCFGGQPKPWDMVRVEMPEGTRAQFSTWQQKVIGTLRVRDPQQMLQLQEGGVAHQLYYFIEADPMP